MPDMALPELKQVRAASRQFVANRLGRFIVGSRLLPGRVGGPGDRVSS